MRLDSSAVRRYSRAIDRTLLGAGPGEVQEGARWYQQASAECRALALELRVPYSTVVGAVAALSPQVRWERNILAARQVLTGAPVSVAAYRANIAKALRIASGEGAAGVLGGAKVRAFYALLLTGGRTLDVCVDSIAILVALGVRPGPEVANDAAAAYFDRPRVLAAIRAAYRRVAKRRGLRPHQVQAITWLAWRNERDKR